MTIYKLDRARVALTGAVGLALLALSLRHLSAGIQAITGSPPLESWLMATGIDLAMVAAEAAILRGVPTRWAHGIIVATLALSGGLNVLAFSAAARGTYGQLLAISLGIFVPGCIYGLIQVLGCRPKHKEKARAVKAVKAVRKTRLHAVQ